MNEREIFANFVSQYRKPFDAEAVTMTTGIPASLVNQLLREFVTHERIKCLCEGANPIYVRFNRYDVRLSAPHGLCVYPEKAADLLTIIEAGNYHSVRELAKAVGKSRQWVYLYLEAMMTVGVVKVVDGYYVAGDKSRLRLVGSQIDKGIIYRVKGRAGKRNED
jgi:hypothetical protein